MQILRHLIPSRLGLGGWPPGGRMGHAPPRRGWQARLLRKWRKKMKIKIKNKKRFPHRPSGQSHPAPAPRLRKAALRLAALGLALAGTRRCCRVLPASGG